VPVILRVRTHSYNDMSVHCLSVLTNSRHRDFEKLLTAVTEEQNKDKAYLIRYLKSSSIYDHVAGFKQKLEDARSNLTVRSVLCSV
jgi:CHAD domain-containing protein